MFTISYCSANPYSKLAHIGDIKYCPLGCTNWAKDMLSQQICGVSCDIVGKRCMVDPGTVIRHPTCKQPQSTGNVSWQNVQDEVDFT